MTDTHTLGKQDPSLYVHISAARHRPPPYCALPRDVVAAIGGPVLSGALQNNALYTSRSLLFSTIVACAMPQYFDKRTLIIHEDAHFIATH